MLNQPDPRMADYAQSRETANPGAADATVRSATADGSYGESQYKNYVDPADNPVENRVEVYQDTNLRRANRRSWVSTIISLSPSGAGSAFWQTCLPEPFSL